MKKATADGESEGEKGSTATGSGHPANRGRDTRYDVEGARVGRSRD